MAKTETTFQYVVVRYVADVARDEAINVGVLVRTPDGSHFAHRFLGRQALTRRFRASNGRDVSRHFEARLEPFTTEGQPALPLEARLPGGTVPSEPDFFNRLAGEMNGLLQLTAPRAEIAGSLHEAVDWCFGRFVADHATQPDRTPRMPTIAPSRMRQRLINTFDRGGLLGKNLVQSGFALQGTHSRWAFDLGYLNGSTNIIQAVALTAPTAQSNLERALVLRGMLEDVKLTRPDLLCTVVVAEEPRKSSVGGAREAGAILVDSGAEVIPLSQLPTLADHVRQALAEHI